MNRLQLRAEHSAQQFYNRRQIPTEEALAGDGVGNLNVSGRLGWLYVRMRGDSTKVTVAYNASSHDFAENDAVSLQWVKRTGIGFYAIVGYSGAAVYDVYGAGSGDGTGSGVRAHAWQHERMDAGQGGPDPLDIFSRMVVPLRARPQTVPDDTLYVEAGYNPLTGNYWAGGNSASFFPVPGTAGQARIDLLYLGSDDLLHIVAGTPVGGGVTPTFPAVVVPSVPLAFVYLAYGQLTIVEANIYMDPGILRAPVGAGGGGAPHDLLDASVDQDTTASTVTRGDLIVGNSTPKWDDLAIGTARQLLAVNAGGTDPEWASFDWDNAGAAAGADMVHDHTSAGEGGTLSFSNLDAGISLVINDGGIVLTAGNKFDFSIPWDGTITGWDLIADVSGDITIDLLDDDYAGFPGGAASIWGTKPALAGADKNQASGLNIAITKGHWMRINVTAPATITRCTLALYITRS